jgi:hypothetical protein
MPTKYISLNVHGSTFVGGVVVLLDIHKGTVRDEVGWLSIRGTPLF